MHRRLTFANAPVAGLHISLAMSNHQARRELPSPGRFNGLQYMAERMRYHPFASQFAFESKSQHIFGAAVYRTQSHTSCYSHIVSCGFRLSR